MYLTRIQSIFLALAVLVLFFILSSLFMESKPTVRSSKESQPTAEERNIQTNDLLEKKPGVDGAGADEEGKSPKFVLHNFHRSETKNGRKLWEVKARSGKYIPEKKAAKIKDAILWFYREEGEVVTLEAKQALLSLEYASLTRANLSGGVTVTSHDGITLKTESAIYEKETATITSPDFVTITSDMVNVSGEELNVDIDKRELTLSKNVSSVITPKKKNESNND